MDVLEGQLGRLLGLVVLVQPAHLLLPELEVGLVPPLLAVKRVGDRLQIGGRMRLHVLKDGLDLLLKSRTLFGRHSCRG